jgi:hypothetical protein
MRNVASIGRTAARGSGYGGALLFAALGMVFAVAPALAETDAEALARLRREIAEAVGDAPCGNAIVCRVVAMGADACGNPTRYVPYSNDPGLKELLETKAAEYTFIEEDMQRGRPRPADCRRVDPPKLACVNRRCVIGDTSY